MQCLTEQNTAKMIANIITTLPTAIAITKTRFDELPELLSLVLFEEDGEDKDD